MALSNDIQFNPNIPNPDKPEPNREKTLPLFYEDNNGKIQRQDIIRIVML
jgi:hypothetical protein